MFLWMSAPFGIDEESWDMAFMFPFNIWLVICVVACVAFILWFYSWRARRRKIYSVTDIFSYYSPMNAIFWSFAAAGLSFIVAAVLCSRLEMPDDTPQVLAIAAISLYMAFITLLLCAGLSYLLIVLVKPLTPMQFCYRPAPYFLFRKGSAR